ncbi:hypothetical protein AMTRI_Chr13g116380 [Amborella trichopoda]
MRIVFKEPSSRVSSVEARHLQSESKTLKIVGGVSSSSNFYLFLLQVTVKKPANINFREREILFFSGEKCAFSDVGFAKKKRWSQKMVTPL